MKKISTVLLAIISVLGIAGCHHPSESQDTLLRDGTINKVVITSLPEGCHYSFDDDDAKAVYDYLSTLTLEDDFEENPDEYNGMTWVISLEYEDSDTITVYHFGNMFIRMENGSWYKMRYDEASQFEALLNELRD